MVADDAVLGEVDEGFRYAQVRLGPGPDDALHALARASPAGRRTSPWTGPPSGGCSGPPLAELGMVQQMIADNEIDIEAGRAG